MLKQLAGPLLQVATVRPISRCICERRYSQQMMPQLNFHLNRHPTFGKQILQLLQPKDGDVYIDLTFGDGAHTKLLLDTGCQILIFAMDRDPQAYARCMQLARLHPTRLVPLLGRFSDIPQLFVEHGIKPSSVDAVLLETGLSDLQLADTRMGWTVSRDGFLDMRMDRMREGGSSITAFDVLNTLDVDELCRIFRLYGQERLAQKYAELIVNSRHMLFNIRTSAELAYLFASVQAGRPKGLENVSASTIANRVLYALRAFVNNELNELQYAIHKVHKYLKPALMPPDEIAACFVETSFDQKKAKWQAKRSKSSRTEDSKWSTAKNDNDDDADENMQNISAIEAAETHLARWQQEAGKLIVITNNQLEDTIAKEQLAELHDHSNILKTRGRSSFVQTIQEDAISVRNPYWQQLFKHVIVLDQSEIDLNIHLNTAKLRAAIKLNQISSLK